MVWWSTRVTRLPTVVNASSPGLTCCSSTCFSSAEHDKQHCPLFPLFDMLLYVFQFSRARETALPFVYTV